MSPHEQNGVDDVSQGDSTTGDAEHDAEEVMDLLAEHVPLALLLDLAVPEGPASDEILRTEGVPDDAWWEPEDEDGTAPTGEAAAEPAAPTPQEDAPQA